MSMWVDHSRLSADCSVLDSGVPPCKLLDSAPARMLPTFDAPGMLREW